MKLPRLLSLVPALLVLVAAVSIVQAESKPTPEAPKPDAEGFYSLFDGKSLDGWKSNDENPGTFKVADGILTVNGKRAHLFYDGPVANHNFKNFELRAQVLVKPNSNSGIYFHTAFEPKGWPSKGYECQLCSDAFKDPRKTGSLYAVKDLDKSPVPDDQWFEYVIRVEGNHIVLGIDGKTVLEYTQEGDAAPNPKMPGRKIGSGTIALQGHDPGSTVQFRSIRIKPL